MKVMWRMAGSQLELRGFTCLSPVLAFGHRLVPTLLRPSRPVSTAYKALGPLSLTTTTTMSSTKPQELTPLGNALAGALGGVFSNAYVELVSEVEIDWLTALLSVVYPLDTYVS